MTKNNFIELIYRNILALFLSELAYDHYYKGNTRPAWETNKKEKTQVLLNFEAMVKF